MDHFNAASKGQWPKKIDVTFVTCRTMNSATICSTTPRHYRGVRYARTDGAYYLLPIISAAHVARKTLPVQN